MEEEQRKKKEKQIMIEGSIITFIIVVLIILVVKVVVIDQEYSEDVMIERTMGRTIEERIKNKQEYFVDYKRKKIVKVREKEYFNSSTGKTEIMYEKTSEKELSDSEIEEIKKLVFSENNAPIELNDFYDTYTYTLSYNLHDKSFYSTVGGKETQFLDEIIKDME